ncbi:ABC-type glycerol-3-phosphate transport system substrate-binding protein [Paenibacillus cellulosilyticus]|uniref:ABC-type glycerol-3-phosphate transport system substrate-binding protein n=1 Tax=Paenibacillus cellulosilyticus TaxID=375489 RepID=A0A2V2YN70_9BACL|nr:ABC transporter substrate-binding protein [Paenibacillus cellulosilyticus]PWV95924.1 ABC-type glycerol-3-phosphate transport system substrate-binding protein [Paenibacillus cellulosilyticus]QKS47786.1 carbohydrate ABC transporter substrate-binding protein [Paenibacillus cellulosilyticus]
MKRFKHALVGVSTLLVMTTALTACGGSSDTKSTSDTSTGTTSTTTTDTTATKSNEKVTINLWSFTDEIPNMTKKYIETHPDANVEFKTTVIATTDGAYQPALDQALAGGGKDAPDIYAAESAFVLKYSQGDASDYAANYADLGLTDQMVTDAGIAQYSVDIGSKEGQLKALGYQATGGGFIYRRSIAKDVFGTDDPAAIKNEVGPGWDKYFEAADKLKAKGYAIVSGDGDIWHPIENSSDTGWVVDGKLHIDPKREQFLDFSKKLTDNGYSNGTQDWQEAWYADMSGAGAKPVFGFFGPAWLINYVMNGQVKDTNGDWAVTEPPTGFFWGGTWLLANKEATKDEAKKQAVADFIKWVTLDTSETGLQYYWANGTMKEGEQGTKDSVASSVVMSKSNGEVPLLGGQNMFDAFVPANANASGKNLTQYDESINLIWRDQVRAYATGGKSREDALKDFKQTVKDQLGIESE